MLNYFNKLKNQKGFTLVELMVVVVIIGILVAIIIPIYNRVQDNAAMKSHEANLRTIDGAISMYVAEEGADPEDIDTLVEVGLLTEKPKIPSRILSATEEGGNNKFLQETNSMEIDKSNNTAYYTIQKSNQTIPPGGDEDDAQFKAFPAPNKANYKDAYRAGDTPVGSSN